MCKAGVRNLRLPTIILACWLAGCTTPSGAPCSNWSATCGCYCGPERTWSGVEPEPLGMAPFTQPTKEMSAEDRTLVRAVYIDQHVTLPKLPQVRTRGGTWAEGLGGAVSVARSMDQSKERATAEYLKKNNIRIDGMLVDAFSTELAAREAFSTVTESASADAVISLLVSRYGVEHTFNPMSRDYRTRLDVYASMIGSGRKLVWGKQCSAESDGQQTATYEQLYGDPETMRTHMLIVAKICAKKLTDHLLGSR